MESTAAHRMVICIEGAYAAMQGIDLVYLN